MRFVFIFLLSTVLGMSQLSAQVNVADSLALVEFYNEMNGDDWTPSVNWLQGPVAIWNGVTVSDGRVTDLFLNSQGIEGDLYLELDLPELRGLSLAGNNLSGPIPDFPNLPSLTSLFIQDNNLSGSIPDFQNMPSLQWLSLSNNDLTGNIPVFSGVAPFEVLYFSDNPGLTGPIPDQPNCPGLLGYYAGNCNLSGEIPDFQLPDLNFLVLGGNNFTGSIPDFSGITENMYALTLDNNELEGTIPDFSNMPTLVKLNLSENNLTGLLPEFFNCPNLDQIAVEGNQLSGPLPLYDHLENLNWFTVCPNNFVGAIPAYQNTELQAGDVDFSCVQGATISGAVVVDGNGNCGLDLGETPVPGALITIGEFGYYAVTDENGEFNTQINLGQQDIFFSIENDHWQQVCDPDYYDLDVQTYEDVFTDVNFLIEPLSNCPEIEVNMGTSFLRRCFNNNYYVEYCNRGSATAISASIEVQLDEYMEVVSSSLEYALTDEGALVFEIGDLGIFECGEFELELYLGCEALLGETFCLKSLAKVDNSCQEVSNTDGLKLQAEIACLENESVQFTVTNIAGDMNLPAVYQLFRNNVQFSAGSFLLGADEIFSEEVPADGAMYSMSITDPNQIPAEQLMVYLEGCGPEDEIDWGQINGLPMADDSSNADIDCREVIGSYDPNDKQVFPKGITEDNCISATQELEYLIRFQNTGTDTAFIVYVIDTLSDHLDPLSIELLDESHPYSLTISENNVLRFDFQDIELPDSNVNEAKSHGYFRFRVKQKQNSPGIVIENRSFIYFDYNDPVETNTVFNTVGPCPVAEVCSEFELDVTASCINDSTQTELAIAILSGFSAEGVTVTDENGIESQYFDSSFVLGPFSDPLIDLKIVPNNAEDCKYRISYSVFDCFLETSIIEFEDTKKPIQLSPVPTRDQLEISFEARTADNGKIAIFNTQGRLVLSESCLLKEGENKLMMNVSSLSPGFYFLTLDGKGNGTQTVKFLVQ